MCKQFRINLSVFLFSNHNSKLYEWKNICDTFFLKISLENAKSRINVTRHLWCLVYKREGVRSQERMRGREEERERETRAAEPRYRMRMRVYLGALSVHRAEPRANIVFTRTHGFAVQIIWYYCTYSTYVCARGKTLRQLQSFPCSIVLPLLCVVALFALRISISPALMLMPHRCIVCAILSPTSHDPRCRNN